MSVDALKWLYGYVNYLKEIFNNRLFQTKMNNKVLFELNRKIKKTND